MIVTIDACVAATVALDWYQDHGLDSWDAIQQPGTQMEVRSTSKKVGTARNFYVNGEQIRAELTILEEYSKSHFILVKEPSGKWIVVAYEPVCVEDIKQLIDSGELRWEELDGPS